MSLQELESKKASLAVIGLGYIGFPVACEFAKAGFDLVGIEKRADRVEQINVGINPLEGEEPGLKELLEVVSASGRLMASGGYETLRNSDVILIDVETPVDENNIPRYELYWGVGREEESV
jgi:UDP-N-acetyl-D-mannosaminuronic acid dehydrogenase